MSIPLFDAHLDLAYNALGYDRDLTRSLADLRRRETLLRPSNCLDTSAPAWQEGWGTAAVSLPAMRSADIRICLGTLLARTSETQALSQVPRRFELDSASPAITEAIAMG